MKNDNLLNELGDDEIDKLMKYTLPYSEDNATNIKNKFIQKAKRKQRKFSVKKLALGIAAASMLLVSTLVYAGVLDFSKIYKIVFGDNSEYIEQYIQPLESEEKSDDKETPGTVESEYDGIVMKLISAINDGDVLRVFATMTDTTGDRLSEDIDFKSWGLSQGHGGNARVVDYNRETKTATILITSLGGNHKGSATLTMNSFTTNRMFKSDLAENKINMYDFLKDRTPNTISQEEVFVNGGASQSKEGQILAEKSRLLKFDEQDIKFANVDWSSISNMGFVDGHLHIQTKKLSDNENDLASINFTNANHEVVYNGHLLLYCTDIENRMYKPDAGPYIQYKEMIYEGITDPEQLKDLSVTIDFMEEGKVTEGKWEFSFEIPEKVTTEFKIDREININGEKIKIDTVSLSPLGITVHLPQNIASNYNHKDSAYVKYEDGSIIELNQASIGGFEDESTLNFGGHVIEIEKVESIVINDEVFNIR